MDDYIDPSADALWGSVGTIESEGKTEFKRPTSDAEWVQLQGHAQKLISGTKHLALAEKAGAPGHGLADASTPGIRTPTQIGRQIADDPARFVRLRNDCKGRGLRRWTLSKLENRTPW